MPIVKDVALRDSVARILITAGADPADAAEVSEHLVEANLCGHDSHGVGILERYVESIQTGGLVPCARASLIRDSGVALVFDGNRGFGQIVGKQVVTQLAERVHQHGLAIASLRNSHHLGRIGAYAEQLADRNLVSLFFVNVRSTSVVAPWGGKEGRFGTNPVCIGVPQDGRRHVVLDFATSLVAMGKARVAYANGRKLSQPAILGPDGRVTNDPRSLYEEPMGALLPFAEHKGSGLAMLCSLLAGILVGGKTEEAAPQFSREIINGMLAIAFNPETLGAAGDWKNEVEHYVDWVKSSALRDGVEKILAPGEPERTGRSSRLEKGIDLDEGTLESLRGAVRRLGGEPDELLAGLVNQAG